MIKTKRAYAPAEKSDGFRVLVDRLWPRGMKKSEAKIDLWLKDIGPSAALRHWFGHDAAKWKEFKARYFKELDGKRELVATVIAREKKGTVTFLYSSREQTYNNAVALKEYLERRLVAA